MATDFLTFHLLGSLHLFILYYKVHTTLFLQTPHLNSFLEFSAIYY